MQTMFDTQLELKDTGAVTASGYGTVDGSAQVLDVGEGQVKGRLVIDVFAIEIGSDDELYLIHLLGKTGDEAKEISLCALELGAGGVTQGGVDSVIGRYELPFSNEKNGTVYPLLRVRHVISGAVTTGINYTARLGEL
jgi:hypothetical protein